MKNHWRFRFRRDCDGMFRFIHIDVGVFDYGDYAFDLGNSAFDAWVSFGLFGFNVELSVERY